MGVIQREVDELFILQAAGRQEVKTVNGAILECPKPFLWGKGKEIRLVYI